MCATVMCLFLLMFILTNRRSVLCVLMSLVMLMLVNVVTVVISPLLICDHCICVWWCSVIFLVF